MDLKPIDRSPRPAARLARALGAAALALASLVHAGPPAGTVIANTASASGVGGTPFVSGSNTVSFIVGGGGPTIAYAATLAANGSVISTPGATVDFGHVLTNTGTAADSYTLAATDLALSFTFTSVTLLPDANGDGVPDSLVPLAGPIVLNPGQAFRFILRVVVPAGAPLQGQDDVRISATSTNAASIVPNVDRVSLNDPNLRLDCGSAAKFISVDRGPSPAAGLTFTLTYNACDQARSRLVLTDTLPAGVRFVPGSARWNGAPAVALTDDVQPNDRQGNIAFNFGVTTPNTVTASVYDIPLGGVGALSFQVEVLPGLAVGTVITNGGGFNYYDAGGNYGLQRNTNSVTYTVTGRADLELIGARLPTGTPGQTLVFNNMLRNLGDATDTFDITFGSSTFPAGTAIQLFQADGVTPLADTDGNGTPDTGPVAAGASYRIVLRALLPASTMPGEYRVTKTARSARSPMRVVTADDIVDTVASLCATTLDPDNQSQTGYGRHVTYTHFLTNRGNCVEDVTARIAYLADSQPGWTSRAFVDNPVAGGASIPGALDATDLPIGQGWTTRMAPGQRMRILVDVLAPTLEAIQSLAKDLVQTNVTTLTLEASRSGALVVRDTTVLDDKAGGATVSNVIRNFTDGTYLVDSLTAVVGRNAWIRADAAACNAVPGVAESRTVVITGPNGEREQLLATETGPDTGIFTIGSLPVRNVAVVPGDRTLQGRPADVFEMEILGCGRVIAGVFTLIEPAGVVFDSRTNTGIAGARVTLVSGAGGQCGAAAVTLAGAANPATTDANGRYAFATVPAGEYCLRVAAPNGYGFPSTVAYTALAPGRNLVVTGPTSGGSYGNAFASAGAGIVVDIPLDAVAQDGLFIQKAASRAVAELGEFVDYTVKVRNNTGNRLDAAPVIVVDDLPAGFAFIPGTARRDNAAIANPPTNGARLSISLGSLDRGAETTLTYRVRLGPGAQQGDGVNRVQASYTVGGSTTRSNVATAKVQVVGGVFSERGFILGKVWLDCNANGRQDKGEAGFPGVRLFLEDGTYVITDGQGKYSFYGIAHRTHVLKLDRTTLPPGAKLSAFSARHLGSGSSRIVDLKAGELHRGDFAIAGCGAALVSEARARAEALSQAPDGLTELAGAQLATEQRVITDPRALPASGVVSLANPAGAPAASLDAPNGAAMLGGNQPLQNPLLTPSSARGPAIARAATPAAMEAPAAVELETLVPTLDNTLGFIGVKDGDVLPAAQATVRVKGTAGSSFKLAVNGVEVPATQVGKRAVLEDKRVQAWEYVGIDMKPGVNELVLTQADGFGNARGREAIKVTAPGRLAKITLDAPAGVADGKTAVRVVVRLADANDTPITARIAVTLDASRGTWQVIDPDPMQEGIQAFVEGGRAEFAILPPTEPGQSLITVIAGTVRAEAKLDFLPELRSLVAAGVLEGIVNIRNINARALTPSRQSDGFEQELRTLSREWQGGERTAGARAAFFLKGKIRGDYLLTAAYDSDKDTRERLFRDIQPDEFYPVYGDSGVRGYDAQSTSRLYVRIDRNRSYLLWGDFTTAAEGNTRKLSNYSRSLTGLKHHYDDGRLTTNLYASRDSLRQVIEELRANGTSGPYQLAQASGALVNSEKVEILTRDRSQPALIVRTVPQARFVDYEIEPLTGRIIFRAPVPSLDENLNPVSVRVTYEVDQGGEPFWVAGGDVQFKVNEHIEVGASYVKDKNPRDPFEMKAANATVRIGRGTVITAEVAQAERTVAASDQPTQGNAARIEVKHRAEKFDIEAYAAKAEAGFDNPGSSVSRGRAEFGAKGTYAISKETRVRVEALSTEDGVTKARRDGVEAVVEHAFANGIRVEAGVRHAKETAVAALPTYPNELNEGSTGTTPNEVTSVRGKIAGPVPGLKDATIFAELEVDTADAERKMAAIGGEYTLPNKGRVYARHEFISSLTGPYGLNSNQRQNTTVLGVDTEYMRDGKLFSEYRIRDALSGGDAEAALGLRNLWTIAPGLRLGTSFERIHALSGKGDAESTALALALEYTANPLWKGTARLEVRDGKTSDSLLSTLGFAAKIANDWTFLARNTYALTRNSGTLGSGDQVRDRMQAGVAFRDSEENRWNALARIEHRTEKDDTQPGISLKSSTQIVSAHADWQPIRPFLVTGRYAAKWTSDRSNGLSTKYRAQVVGGRVSWEFAPKWDVAMVASLVVGDSAASRQYGLGLELGYLVATNLWVSAGYNFHGYKDADLAGADYTTKGAYVRLRYKFDEDLLERFAPKPATEAAK